MSFKWRKLVLFLVLLIAVLQLIHMALLNKLDSLRAERKRRARQGAADVYLNGQKAGNSRYIERDRKRMQDMIKDSSILDSFGEYQIINHLVRAEALGIRNFIRADVSLVTQTSISQLQHLPFLVERWNGLVSVTLFVLTQDLNSAVEAILLLRKCSPRIREQVSFHLVYPLRVPPPKVGAAVVTHPSPTPVTEDTDCTILDQLIEALDPAVLNYDHSGVPYPNNLLRNVARRNSLTEFIFLVDIDLVVSDNLRGDFLQFATENGLFGTSQKDDKTVYVVPAFEVKAEMSNERIPKDKNGLLELLSNLEVRPFYFELCWKCQKHTDYEAWQREPQGPKLAALFEVLWRDPWEPFYISRNTVPMYDERFRQYGFNRISQVCELHIAGYKFSVLNNAFVVHRGWKTPDSFHAEKDLEQEKNRILFRQFKAELKERYPDSSRRCY